MLVDRNKEMLIQGMLAREVSCLGCIFSESQKGLGWKGTLEII